MREPIGYFSGCLVPAKDIRLPLNDRGLTSGVLISEQLRTFGGQAHLIDRHMNRLASGCRSVGIVMDQVAISRAIDEVSRCNYALAPAGSDLQVSVLVTPGSGGDSAGAAEPFTVIVSTNVLPLGEIARQYRDGIHLVPVPVREIPGECIPRHIKHRNRLHYWLAERAASARATDARAVMLDLAGNVLEATTAAIAIVDPEGKLIAPPADEVLPSISLKFTTELPGIDKLNFTEQRLSIRHLKEAREILLFSTPVCVLPVTRLEGSLIGTGRPGPVFHVVAEAWSLATGVDIVRQAGRFPLDSV